MSIDLSLARCCDFFTRTSELRVRQSIVDTITWVSLRDTIVRSVMLFGIINSSFLGMPHLLLLKPWCTMIEQGDTTRPAVVPFEPSEAVKE